MGSGEIGVTVATFPTAPLPEAATMEQQVLLASPSISDVEHLVRGWRHASDAAASQQHTGCTTSSAMLHR